MRGADGSSDKRLRWALVGGIVVVVVIATIIAVSGAFNKNASAPPKTPTPTPTSKCLFPSTVHVASQVLVAPATTTSHVSHLLARAHLKAIVRVLTRHRSSFVAVSPNGRHFIAARAGGLVVGTAGHSTVVKLPANVEDIAFNAKGGKLIYEVSPSSTNHACASTVLMTIGLHGKKRTLLLASRYSLLNAATPASTGTLMQDQLLNGWIVLVDGAGRLFAFDPKHDVIGPIQTGSIAALSTSASASQPAVQVSVSPTLKYFAVSSSQGTGFTIHTLPGGARIQTVSGVSFPVAWSHSGTRIAFVSHKQSSVGSTSQVITTMNLKTGKVFHVQVKNKRLRPLTISNIHWSPDDRLIGFTGASTACAAASTCRVHGFIGTWKGKHVHAIAVSSTQHSQSGGTTHY
jgi:hypothetical protein